MVKKNYIGEKCWIRQEGDKWEQFQIVAIYPGVVIFTDGVKFHQMSFNKTSLVDPRGKGVK